MSNSVYNEDDSFDLIKNKLYATGKENNNYKQTKSIEKSWKCCNIEIKNHLYINILPNSSYMLKNNIKNWFNFYMKTCSNNVGMVFTEGIFDLKHIFKSKQKSNFNECNSSLLNEFKEFTSRFHSTGTKIFFTIAPELGRGIKEEVNLYNYSASFNKSYDDSNYVCLRISDGKLKDLILKTKELVKFAKEVNFDGVLLDFTAFNIFGEMRSYEFNRRYFGYYSGTKEYLYSLISNVVSIVDDYPIFLKITPYTYIKEILDDSLNEVYSTKRINTKSNELISDCLTDLVKIGVDGFMFCFGTHETEFLANGTEFIKNDLYFEFYKCAREYFNSNNIKNKFGQDVYLFYHGDVSINKSTLELVENNTINTIDITRDFYVNYDKYYNKKPQKHVKSCIKCCYCNDFADKFGKVKCAINPFLGGYEVNQITYKEKKQIAVIGSGVSGIYASLILAERGFIVDLYEEDSIINKRSKQCSVFGFDYKYNDLMLYFERKLNFFANKNKINIYLNKKFLPKKEDFYPYSTIIIATGFRERFLNVTGAVLKSVKSIYDILNSKEELLNNYSIVIYAKSELSIKLALYLNSLNKKVTLVIPSFKLFKDLPNAKLTYYAYILTKLKIKTYMFARAKKINEDSVDLIINNKLEKLSLSAVMLNCNSNIEYSYLPEAKNIDCDLFIYEPELYSNNKLYYDLIKAGYQGELFMVGNALEIGTLADDIHSAFFVANNI